MSFDALSWAAKQAPGSSGAKLVLLGLAECADRSHNLAFPSIAALVEFCCLDRKSVIANLAKLEAAGLITDTGRRVGQTKQIKVYQLHVQTVPEVEPSQKRNSTGNSDNSPKNGTRNLSEPVKSEAKASSQRVVEAWNAMAGKHSKVAAVRLLDNSRRQQLSARLKEHGEAVLLEAIGKFGSTPWLVGVGRDSKWRPNIDFILQPSSLRKVLEGTYGADDAPVARPIKDQVKHFEELAKFYRRIGRDDEAATAERKLAQLRAARSCQDNGEAVSVGAAASKLLATVGGSASR